MPTLSDVNDRQMRAFLAALLHTTRKMWKMAEKIFKDELNSLGKCCHGTDRFVIEHSNINFVLQF